MGHTKSRPAKRAKAGRPPAGIDGEKVSKYAQVTIRLPAPSKRLLDAVTAMTGWPAWRVFDRALQALVRELPTEDRRVLDLVQARRGRPD